MRWPKLSDAQARGHRNLARTALGAARPHHNDSLRNPCPRPQGEAKRRTTRHVSPGSEEPTFAHLGSRMFVADNMDGADRLRTLCSGMHGARGGATDVGRLSSATCTSRQARTRT